VIWSIISQIDDFIEKFSLKILIAGNSSIKYYFKKWYVYTLKSNTLYIASTVQISGKSTIHF